MIPLSAAACYESAGNGRIIKNKSGAKTIRRGTKQMRAALTLAALIGLAGCLGGCSDTGPAMPARFSQLMRSYDNTLTPAQQKAAIAQLQEDQVKQEDAAKQ